MSRWRLTGSPITTPALNRGFRRGSREPAVGSTQHSSSPGLKIQTVFLFFDESTANTSWLQFSLFSFYILGRERHRRRARALPSTESPSKCLPQPGLRPAEPSSIALHLGLSFWNPGRQHCHPGQLEGSWTGGGGRTRTQELNTKCLPPFCFPLFWSSLRIK